MLSFTTSKAAYTQRGFGGMSVERVRIAALWIWIDGTDKSLAKKSPEVPPASRRGHAPVRIGCPT